MKQTQIYDRFPSGYLQNKLEKKQQQKYELEEKKTRFQIKPIISENRSTIGFSFFDFDIFSFHSLQSPIFSPLNVIYLVMNKKSSFTIVTSPSIVRLVFGVYLMEIERFIKCSTLTKGKPRRFYDKWVNN